MCIIQRIKRDSKVFRDRQLCLARSPFLRNMIRRQLNKDLDEAEEGTVYIDVGLRCVRPCRSSLTSAPGALIPSVISSHPMRHTGSAATPVSAPPTSRTSWGDESSNKV